MIVLSSAADDAAILGVARQWVAALAAGDFDGAFAMTAHDPYYAWSPNLMRRVIAGYGLPEPTPDGVEHRVTPEATAQGGPTPRHEVTWYSEPRALADGRRVVAQVWYDLPMDGAWSDLTATFEVLRDTTGTVLVLNEIHVF
jgi:hypothetical protein